MIEELIKDVGFPAAVVIYLLYERAKFNQKILEKLTIMSVNMDMLSTSMERIVTRIRDISVRHRHQKGGQ